MLMLMLMSSEHAYHTFPVAIRTVEESVLVDNQQHILHPQTPAVLKDT
jgi:hypothetical protein